MNDIQKSNFPIRWDAHVCPPLKIGSDLSFLERYKKSGVDFISLNVGFDLNSRAEILALIDYFRHWFLERNDKYMIVNDVASITSCKAHNKLAIAFDIEGSTLLDGDIEMVEELYELGVKQLVFTYNQNNIAGGGCLDHDKGLTVFGKRLIQKCNNVGMMIDCSHVGYRTSMDIIENSEYPVVFSHSNPAALLSHPRNISDEQINACANRGGVIGITGVGIFLGNNNISSEKIVEHIDYVIQKVGVKHVGLGLDCVFDDEIKNYVKNNADMFPVKHGFDDVVVAQPEQFMEIADLLIKNGYSQNDINNILGENFLRIAKIVWK